MSSVTPGFWKGRKVLVTGHTGFKGAWLALWLESLGADVSGLALAPPAEPNLYTLARVAQSMRSVIGDVRDPAVIRRVLSEAQPEIVIHMAAQSLVRASYADPVGTYETNVMGLVHLLEAIRDSSVRTVVVVTSDKCYENHERAEPYREGEALGGRDPYSSSKGAAELVAAAYRRSFLAPAGIGLASARAGNVIGGADFARDRIIPDAIRAFTAAEPLLVRNPGAVRPWQHVLEALRGYLRLAELLHQQPAEYASAWNFGPDQEDEKPVSWIADELVRLWGEGARWVRDTEQHPHEARYLRLDSSRARSQLGWKPRWSLPEALARTMQVYRAWHGRSDVRTACLDQLREYAPAPVAQAEVAGQ